MMLSEPLGAGYREGVEPAGVEDDVRGQLVSLLPRLRRFAHTLTPSRGEAEGLVQDTCERALGRLYQWRPGSRLDCWLFRIMHTIRLNQLVSTRRIVGNDADVDEQMGMDGVTYFENRLRLQEVRRAIDELPVLQREILELVCYSGLRYREAAAALEIPIGTVMSRLASARLSLHAKLAALENDAGDDGREVER